MASFLQRILGRPRSVIELKTAALQLRLLVAMAAADHRINDFELEQILDFIDRSARNDRDHDHLTALMDAQFAAPALLEDVLEELTGHAPSRALGIGLAHELANVAWSDEEIDHREEFLLHLVCDVFGLPPMPLFDSSADDELDDMRAFVHRLAGANRAA